MCAEVVSVDVDRAVSAAWSRYKRDATAGSDDYVTRTTVTDAADDDQWYAPFGVGRSHGHSLRSCRQAEDAQQQTQRQQQQQPLGPLKSEAWTRWRRNGARFAEAALCYVTFPRAGSYVVTLSCKRHLSSLGTPRGITVIGAPNESNASEPAVGGHVRVNQGTLELLSATSLTQKVASLAQAASTAPPPTPSIGSVGGGGGGGDEEGFIAIGSYIVHCDATMTYSEPYVYEPFTALGMWLPQHTPYRLVTDAENNCRTTLNVPRSIHIACQLRRGGLLYDEGWVRVHRSLDSANVVVDVTVPERGVYQLVVLGSGASTENKYKQALVHEVVCESSHTTEAPAAVGELFQAVGLELDSHPYTVVTADEHNHALISLLVPRDLDVAFKTQLRSGEATLSAAWINETRNERDGTCSHDIT